MENSKKSHICWGKGGFDWLGQDSVKGGGDNRVGGGANLKGSLVGGPIRGRFPSRTESAGLPPPRPEIGNMGLRGCQSVDSFALPEGEGLSASD